jgi:serine/threonine protein kinase
MALEEGDLLGEYEIVEEIGEGRYGVVYRAVDTRDETRQEYALKVLNSKVASDYDAVRREAELWKSACFPAHPNIVRFCRFVTEKKGRKDYYFHVCDFVSSGSLRDWLDDAKRTNPTVDEAIILIQGILSGLERLHTTTIERPGEPPSIGIVHRDLKPDNILLSGGVPQITDFGLSRVLNSALSTRAGKGAMAYASPEDIRGENPAVSMDLWSASVIFYELLVGHQPFRGPDHTITHAILNDVPHFPDSLPSGLRAVLERALDRNPANRYESAAALRKAIDDANPRRVFISYSHDSETHRETALNLAQRLRSEGIACEIDQFYEDVPPAYAWPIWMNREIERSQHVLVVCTERYRRRFEGKEEPGRGLSSPSKSMRSRGAIRSSSRSFSGVEIPSISLLYCGVRPIIASRQKRTMMLSTIA